jgi:hypothetical protein
MRRELAHCGYCANDSHNDMGNSRDDGVNAVANGGKNGTLDEGDSDKITDLLGGVIYVP